MRGIRIVLLAGFLLFLAVLLLVITLGLALPIALPMMAIALVMVGMGIAGRDKARAGKRERPESKR